MIQNQALGFYQCREKKQKKQDERKRWVIQLIKVNKDLIYG